MWLSFVQGIDGETYWSPLQCFTLFRVTDSVNHDVVARLRLVYMLVFLKGYSFFDILVELFFNRCGVSCHFPFSSDNRRGVHVLRKLKY